MTVEINTNAVRKSSNRNGRKFPGKPTILQCVTKLCAVLINLALLFASPAKAELELTVEEAKRRLTGGYSKEWVFKRFKHILRTNGSCKEGEIWQFHSKGQVEIRECIKQQIVRKTKKWKLKKESDLDLKITIGDTKYTIRFLPSKAKSECEEMRLRIISPEKTTYTVDRYFTYERD